MEHNRLLEIAAERAMCDLCADCGEDACITCHKRKGVTADELREYHSAVYAALRRTAEDDKAREEGRSEKLALAMRAGARAIDQSKRLCGATYCYDVFGERGEPKEISYYEAANILRQEAEAALGGGEGAEYKTVTIPACVEHYGRFTMTARLKWVCPICGEPRGEVHQVFSYDGSLRLTCDGWTNPCGHVDKYSDVRKEAALSERCGVE